MEFGYVFMICVEWAVNGNVYCKLNTLHFDYFGFNNWTFETVCATTRDQSTAFAVQSDLFLKLTKMTKMTYTWSVYVIYFTCIFSKILWFPQFVLQTLQFYAKNDLSSDFELCIPERMPLYLVGISTITPKNWPKKFKKKSNSNCKIGGRTISQKIKIPKKA